MLMVLPLELYESNKELTMLLFETCPVPFLDGRDRNDHDCSTKNERSVIFPMD